MLQPEYVHCIADLPFTMAQSTALQLLKGISVKLFFEHKEKTRLRYPRGHLRSLGKFVASIGFIQLETAKNYVRNQDEHHARSLALKGEE